MKSKLGFGLHSAHCAIVVACGLPFFFGCAKSKGSALYHAADGSFSCELPANWRLIENHGGARAAAFGPPDGKKPYGAAIAIYFYGPETYAGPDVYLKKFADSSPVAKERIGDRSILRFSAERTRPVDGSPVPETVREETYLIPASNGFYAVVLICSPESCADILPAAFRAVKTFTAR